MKICRHRPYGCAEGKSCPPLLREEILVKTRSKLISLLFYLGSVVEGHSIRSLMNTRCTVDLHILHYGPLSWCASESLRMWHYRMSIPPIQTRHSRFLLMSKGCNVNFDFSSLSPFYTHTELKLSIRVWGAEPEWLWSWLMVIVLPILNFEAPSKLF